MRRRNLAIGALAFALGAPGMPSPARAGGDAAPLTTRLQQAADAYVAERAGPEHITGVALQVDLGGRGPGVFVSSGTDGRRPDPQPMAEDTLFQTGSNTNRQFTPEALTAAVDPDQMSNQAAHTS